MICLDESRVVFCDARLLPIWAAGPLDILDGDKTGFFCSSRCPGGIILKTFDAITAMRDQGRTLIGGFHSPMEWECLGISTRRASRVGLL